MKVLMLNGSPRKGSNTGAALEEMAGVLAAENIECETVQVGQLPIVGCRACGACGRTGKCAVDDIVNDIAARLRDADGLVLASPVYYAGPNSSLTALCDRLFFSAGFDMTMKVGAAVVCARRGGTTAAFDRLNKYFTISGMPVVSGYYWNNVHGAAPGESLQDAEGMWNVRCLAGNMAFLMKSIAMGKAAMGLPERWPAERTNFIR
ncbi:MAG: flavodoxin family protein [Abditibacteriota bacterium]|nr:flavodoxin family protein [Abditibacteriota bacterium]